LSLIKPDKNLKSGEITLEEGKPGMLFQAEKKKVSKFASRMLHREKSLFEDDAKNVTDIVRKVNKLETEKSELPNKKLYAAHHWHRKTLKRKVELIMD